MIGKVQQDIFFLDQVRYPSFGHQWMIKWFFSLTFFRKDLFRKIHEMPEIVNPSTGYQVILFDRFSRRTRYSSNPGSISRSYTKRPVLPFRRFLTPFSNFLNNIGGYVMVNINFRIPGYFKNMGLVMVIAEIGENISGRLNRMTSSNKIIWCSSVLVEGRILKRFMVRLGISIRAYFLMKGHFLFSTSLHRGRWFYLLMPETVECFQSSME
jgi:hypothetical protein